MFTIVLLLAVPGGAGQGLRVQGQVELESGKSGEHLEVELMRQRVGQPPICARVEDSGSFALDGVEPGDYNLLVTNSEGDAIHQELVSIGEGTFLKLKVLVREPLAESGALDTVSVRQLQRNVPGAARKEFDKSRRAVSKGDYPSAVSHLRKAIKIYPDFAEAHNDLGVYYSRMNDPKDSLEEFQKARDLDPDSAWFNTNLSAALLQQGFYKDSALAARQALRTAPGDELTRLVLGLSLKALHRTAEALDNLRLAAERFPDARLAAAEILQHSGQVAAAQEELRAYLKSSFAPRRNRQLARAWLTELERR